MFQLISIVLTVYAIYLMVAKKKGLTQVSQEFLTRNEKIIIWIICFFDPIWGGAIFYYGWKKILPQKAKTANHISLWMFLIQIVVGVTFGFLRGRGLI